MAGGDGLFRRHLIGIALGLAAAGGAVGVRLPDVQGLAGTARDLRYVLLILSPRIPGLGYEAGGATSWLAIGGFRLFQPSEPAKLVTILIMAIVIAQYRGRDRQAQGRRADPRATWRYRSASSCCSPTSGPRWCSSPSRWACCSIGGLKARYFLVFALIGVLAVGLVLQFDLLDAVPGGPTARLHRPGRAIRGGRATTLRSPRSRSARASSRARVSVLALSPT